ncbi:ACR3 family arsenite efflux pump ArsB [Pseudoxanthomonas japonensis]|uniref:arsenic resistance protein n=1 Tax=Pseudoxanthomonas japonensis TaxID=69284 RepID=UPI0028572105|nr:arsenic resistance protein [Pseudoxanthomonas japonensis]MDR7068092.1 ACR3 family arsenite efflux pump ArsB [Pseudoxanthomonas japonensis]
MNPDHAREQLEQYQTPIYFGALVVGFVLAMLIPGTGRLEAAINPALGVMLFVTFLQVPLARIRASLSNLRFMSALLVANFIVIPLLVALVLPFFPADPLIRIAILFVLLCPCIDYVVTFSHLGKSDSSLLLAATPVLLILQMILLPIYLNLFLGQAASDLVEPGPFVHAFVILIAIPMALAAMLQALATRFAGAAKAARIGGLLPVPATALVLLIVIAAVAPQLGPALRAAMSALPYYIAYAIAAPLLGLAIARAFRLRAPAARSVGFATATRNSLVVLPLALTVPNALPTVPAVVVTQTLVELAAMLVYIRLMPKFAQK